MLQFTLLNDFIKWVNMRISYFQKGFNYSQDGPGNRLVIHLQGCNLHCPWCSNPEGMAINGGICVSVDQLFSEILSCQRLFFDGGGVTLSGGECTLQKESVKLLLQKCKEHAINTAIETNATFAFDLSFFECVDLIICDFKHYDQQKLQSQVGNVGNYKENVKNYLESGKQIVIRTVLINGFNATCKDAHNFANFFKDLPTQNASFEFLPYHEYGKNKWLKLGKPYQMQNAFISEEQLSLFEKIYNSYNLKTIRS